MNVLTTVGQSGLDMNAAGCELVLGDIGRR